jgi:broad specificity phosphatase PhoE
MEERRIWLVRHGETEWSKSGQHTGTTDLPLTDNGYAQAKTLRPLLHKAQFVAVLSSPRTRARVTCEQALEIEPQVDEDLAEWNYGTYEGRTSADIHAVNPNWSLWIDGGPGGESPDQIGQRADRLLARVAQINAGKGDVALFAHGHILRVLALRYLGWPMELGAQLGLDTATLSKLGLVSHHAAIVCWNVRP